MAATSQPQGQAPGAHADSPGDVPVSRPCGTGGRRGIVAIIRASGPASVRMACQLKASIFVLVFHVPFASSFAVLAAPLPPTKKLAIRRTAAAAVKP